MPVALLSSPTPTAKVLPSPDSATLHPKWSCSSVLEALKYPIASTNVPVTSSGAESVQPKSLQARTL
jgi:hypothetical protein